MHRPRLLNLVTNWLESAQSVPFDAATPLVGRGLDEVAGRAFVATESGSTQIGYLTAIVRTYENESAAASATRALLADAGDVHGTPGVAVVNRRERPLPGCLGGVVTWGTVRGFDAERSAWAMAVVRSGELVWDVTVTGVGISSLERTVIDIAGIVSRRVPSEWGLWDLLPDVADLPGPDEDRRRVHRSHSCHNRGVTEDNSPPVAIVLRDDEAQPRVESPSRTAAVSLAIRGGLA